MVLGPSSLENSHIGNSQQMCEIRLGRKEVNMYKKKDAYRIRMIFLNLEEEYFNIFRQVSHFLF